MKIDKISGQYNTYKLEVSYGQLMSFMQALEQDHSSAESDEVLAELRWYTDHLPKPGEEEDDVKAREEGQLGPEGQTPSDETSEEDSMLPMPPTEAEDGDMSEEPPLPTGTEGDVPEDEQAAPGLDAGIPPEAGAEEPAPEDTEEEEELPEPPAE